MLEKRMSAGEVMMWTDFVTTAKFPKWQRKTFIQDQKMTGACEPCQDVMMQTSRVFRT